MKLNEIIDDIIDKSFRRSARGINQSNQNNATTAGTSSPQTSSGAGGGASTSTEVGQLRQRLEVLTLQVNLLHEVLQFMLTFGHTQLDDECLRQFVLNSCPPSVQQILFINRALLDKVVSELKANNLAFI